MAYPARCENCTNYKLHNKLKGECTHANHKDKSAMTKFRKRHDKCVNAAEFNSK